MPQMQPKQENNQETLDLSRSLFRWVDLNSYEHMEYGVWKSLFDAPSIVLMAALKAPPPQSEGTLRICACL